MIRKLKEQDYDKVLKLVYQVHDLHCKNRPDIYKKGNPLPIEYFKNIITNKNSLNYVYEENNNILGIIMATKKSNNDIPIARKRKVYYIEDIVVDISYRRQKIGKRLYDFLVNKAKENNIDAIELNVWSFNEVAIKFYESLGMSTKNMILEQLLISNKFEK